MDTLATLFLDLNNFKNRKQLQHQLQNLINDIRLLCDEYNFSGALKKFTKILACLKHYYENNMVTKERYVHMCECVEQVKKNISNLNDAYPLKIPSSNISNPIHKKQEQQVHILLSKLETCLMTYKNNDTHFCTII